MIVHGATELVALSRRCNVITLEPVNGWDTEIWELDTDDVAAAITVYRAVLRGAATDPVVALLADYGIDLTALLEDAPSSKDDITRADITELIAAASMLASDGWSVGDLYMPNVPKMSRRKSENGVDIFGVRLQHLPSEKDLGADEALSVASVKHTIEGSSAGMRWKLAQSLDGKQLSPAYMTQQLRVLNGHSRREGYSVEAASRVYMFLRGFATAEGTDILGVGVVDPKLKDDLAHHITLLPESPSGHRTFRQILVPDLANLANRCP